MTPYERRRRQIAQREYNRRRSADYNFRNQNQSFDSWYSGTFLMDILFINMVMDEIGSEESYNEESAQEEDSNKYEQESTTDDDHSNYGGGSDDSGSDSGSSD